MATKSKSKQPKLKTHKAASSRIHVTGTGKLMRLKGNQSHFRRRKTASTKRQFGGKFAIPASDASRLRLLIPHGVP